LGVLRRKAEQVKEAIACYRKVKEFDPLFEIARASGRSTTDSLERKVPTAVTVSRLWPIRGFVASTWAAGMPAGGPGRG
jgi:hypothetical protein